MPSYNDNQCSLTWHACSPTLCAINQAGWQLAALPCIVAWILLGFANRTSSRQKPAQVAVQGCSCALFNPNIAIIPPAVRYCLGSLWQIWPVPAVLKSRTQLISIGLPRRVRHAISQFIKFTTRDKNYAYVFVELDHLASDGRHPCPVNMRPIKHSFLRGANRDFSEGAYLRHRDRSLENTSFRMLESMQKWPVFTSAQLAPATRVRAQSLK